MSRILSFVLIAVLTAPVVIKVKKKPASKKAAGNAAQVQILRDQRGKAIGSFEVKK
jgi:hypothetical protein